MWSTQRHWPVEACRAAAVGMAHAFNNGTSGASSSSSRVPPHSPVTSAPGNTARKSRSNRLSRERSDGAMSSSSSSAASASARRIKKQSSSSSFRYRQPQFKSPVAGDGVRFRFFVKGSTEDLERQKVAESGGDDGSAEAGSRVEGEETGAAAATAADTVASTGAASSSASSVANGSGRSSAGAGAGAPETSQSPQSTFVKPRVRVDEPSLQQRQRSSHRRDMSKSASAHSVRSTGAHSTRSGRSMGGGSTGSRPSSAGSKKRTFNDSIFEVNEAGMKRSPSFTLGKVCTLFCSACFVVWCAC